jgi:hypothetical protein
MPDCENQNWIQEDSAFTESDKFVPNPYDEKPTTTPKTPITTINDLIKLYPNPCKELLMVEIKQAVQDLYLVDMSGKALQLLHAQKRGKVEIDMRNLASGIYFVKVFYSGKWYSGKVVKM